MKLHRAGRPLVIGHRGAAALAPENTLAALAAAVDAGADVVEFDVTDGLWVGHGRSVANELHLDDALSFLRGGQILIQVDMKSRGIELDVVARVRDHGVEERTIVSSTSTAALRIIEGEAPELTRAVGYPEDSYGVSRVPWPRTVVAAAASTARRGMPLRASLLIDRSRAHVLALHHALVSPRVVRLAHARNVAVLAWTANDAATVERLRSCGVDAISSDDPAMAVACLARA